MESDVPKSAGGGPQTDPLLQDTTQVTWPALRMEEDMKNLKTSGYRSVEVQPDIDQYSFIRVGDKKTISELRQELAKKQEDRQVQSGPRREEETA